MIDVLDDLIIWGMHDDRKASPDFQGFGMLGQLLVLLYADSIHLPSLPFWEAMIQYIYRIMGSALVDIVTRQSLSRLVKFQASYDTPEMRALFANPDKIMRENAVRLFKEDPGDTSTVVQVNYYGQNFIIKRYNLKGFWHTLKRAILPSNARRSWSNAIMLQELGVPSIQPVALIENRCGFLKGKTYLVTKFVHGVLGIDYFHPNSPCKAHWEEAMINIRSLVKLMHDHCIVHDDFSFLNLLMVGEQPVLLDLDHLRRFSKSCPAFLKAHKRDLQHFRWYLNNDSPQARDLFDKLILP